MNIEELEIIANEFLEEYGMNLQIPIVINNRLRVSMGSFAHTDKSIRIELSGQLIKLAHHSIIIDTLKHELIHYALFEMKEPYRDHDQNFINECKRLGVGLTEEVYFGEDYQLECCKCKKILISNCKSHLNTSKIGLKYSTACCNSSYQHISTIVSDGLKTIVKYVKNNDKKLSLF